MSDQWSQHPLRVPHADETRLCLQVLASVLTFTATLLSCLGLGLLISKTESTLWFPLKSRVHYSY